MNVLEPLTPNYGSGITLTATSTSAKASINVDAKGLIITNLGDNIAYIKVGKTNAVASTADYPIMPYTQVVITKSIEHDSIGYISALGASLHVMIGEGW